MHTHVYTHRVRYRECDPMGVVYHAHYLDYFEAARTEALRALGIAYRDLETSGVMMPVIEANVQYKRPAHYDDLLRISTHFTQIPTVRIPIEYEVHRTEEDVLVATGQVTLCFMSTEHRRPIPAPDAVRHTLEEALQGTTEAS